MPPMASTISSSANKEHDDLFRSDVPYLPVSRSPCLEGLDDFPVLVDFWGRWVDHDDFYFTADIEFLGNAASLRPGEAVSPASGLLNLNSCGCGIDEGNRINPFHPLCVPAFLKLLDHTLQVGIASIKIKDRRGPVPTPAGNSLPVRPHLELTSRARYSDGFNA